MRFQPPVDVESLPVTFVVGTHSVVVVRRERRWTATVDGTPGVETYPTQADAWEAGVRTADALDRAATR
jgi:hypothetical protein